MTELKTPAEPFETLAKVLLRAFLLGYALLLLWVAICLATPEVLYRPAAQLFGLTAHEVDLVQYCGIAFVKCVLLVFFLFPYVAIRTVLRNRA